MITERIMVESIKHIMSLDIRERETLTDEIFANQPGLLGTVLVLSKLNVSMAKIEEVLFILLVLYQAFQKRSGICIPLIKEEMIEKAHDNNNAMLKYLDKEGLVEGSNLIGKAIMDSPNNFVAAFVLGHLNEHGFSTFSQENEHCIRSAKAIMDCFIEAANRAVK